MDNENNEVNFITINSSETSNTEEPKDEINTPIEEESPFKETEFGQTYYSSSPKKKRKKKEPKYVTRKALAIILVFTIILSAAVGAFAYAIAISVFGGTSIDKSINTVTYNLATSTGSILSLQEIIAKNENSVVAIETESISTDFWLGQYVTQGAGSGVVFKEDGYIITNNHVIKGARNIVVTLHNGDKYDASVVASDAQTDLAVLKIEATGLIPVVMGDSSNACAGDVVVAIGNPLGTLSGTATEGIISALEREITIDGKTMTLIQTSASINPGNSGGGLFDQYGKLIGIVVAKSAGSNVEGLGFAIPVDNVSTVAEALIANGYVAGRPAAGISVVEITDYQSMLRYGVSIPGVYIQDVTSESAYEAGLRPGDMVYYIDDIKITNNAALLAAIQKHAVGDTVEFTVVRDNEILKYQVTLQESKQQVEK